MRKLKASFWISCCIHLGLLAGISFFATTLDRQRVEPETSVPLIELIAAPIETAPKLIAAPVLPQKTLEQKPRVVPPPKIEKPEPIVQKAPEPPVKTEDIRQITSAPPAPLIKEEVIKPVSAPLERITAPTVEETSGSVSSERKSSQLITAQPRYRDNPEPSYPLLAQRRHQEGTVLLLVAVNPSGRADAIAVKESSGFSTLDDAARNAVRHWTFDPARSDGEPVTSKVEVPVRFQLSK